MAKHDNWQTPPALMSRLREEFHFTLDAAADAQNAVCERFITAEMDALAQPWDADDVWCNPPYSRLPEFTEKAGLECWERENTIVMLVPAYTDTRWWANWVAWQATEIRFLVGRLRFWENGAPGKDTARFPSALVIYRPQVRGLWRPTLHTYWDWRI